MIDKLKQFCLFTYNRMTIIPPGNDTYSPVELQHIEYIQRYKKGEIMKKDVKALCTGEK